MPNMRQVAFEDFDPNNLSVWAVYAGGTRFKCYATRGPALAGLMSWGRAKLYENVAGRWVLRAVKDADAHNDTCEVCQHQGVKASYGSWSVRPWAWKRLNGGRSKIVDPPQLLFICAPCRRNLGL